MHVDRKFPPSSSPPAAEMSPRARHRIGEGNVKKPHVKDVEDKGYPLFHLGVYHLPYLHGTDWIENHDTQLKPQSRHN